MPLELKVRARDESQRVSVVPAAAQTGAAPGQGQGGFRARIDGVTLWDLVQMECLSGARNAVRVQSGARRGYLFFDRGQLVHAKHGAAVGDAAALAVLAWTRGEIAPCELPWPRAQTVCSTWQSLLMQAAQQQDELQAPAPAAGDEAASRNSGVLRISAGHAAEHEEHADDEVEIEWLEETFDYQDGRDPDGVQAHGSVPDFHDMAHGRAARLNAAGEITATLGDAEALAGQAAYTARLLSLLGEMLSLGPARALEVRSAAGPSFLELDEHGILALAPSRGEDATRIRKELAL